MVGFVNNQKVLHIQRFPTRDTACPGLPRHRRHNDMAILEKYRVSMTDRGRLSMVPTIGFRSSSVTTPSCRSSPSVRNFACVWVRSGEEGTMTSKEPHRADKRRNHGFSFAGASRHHDSSWCPVKAPVGTNRVKRADLRRTESGPEIARHYLFLPPHSGCRRASQRCNISLLVVSTRRSWSCPSSSRWESQYDDPSSC